MNNKLISVGMVALLVISGFLGFITFESEVVSGGDTWYVGSGPGNDSANVQGGIDLASEHDTVFVYQGIYYENLVINKSLTLIGEDQDNTIIDGGGISNVINITADWVNITGFTLSNSSSRHLHQAGVELKNAHNCFIYNNTISSNHIGINLRDSNNNKIFNNTIYANKAYGIDTYRSDYNIIEGNTICSNNYTGIGIDYSSGNIIKGNNVSYNRHGIHIDGTANIIDGNYVTSNNGKGITLWSCEDNIFYNNTFWDDGIFLWGYYIEDFNSHSIDTSNPVNGKPVYYWKNQNGGIIPNDAGQIILANCQNITVENLELNNVSIGIELAYSSNCNIISNNISSSKVYGIYLVKSHGNNIINNNISNSQKGIEVIYLGGNFITGNTIQSNVEEGIHLDQADNNEINNNFIFNNKDGICLASSTDTILSNNTMKGGGIKIDFDYYKLYLDEWNTHTIDTSNTLNGKPVYYWKNINYDTMPLDAGQIILVNCTNITIENQEIINVSLGILVGFSSYIFIKGNIISSCEYGIILLASEMSIIERNTISYNNNNGIFYNHDCLKNKILENNVSSNDYGIKLLSSRNNLVKKNEVSHNNVGLCLSSSLCWNDIINNTISSNNEYGIYISYESSGNKIIGNTIIKNKYGIYLAASEYMRNTVYHNNFINNNNHSFIEKDYYNREYDWDNDYPSGGNYWSDYPGPDLFKGLNQDIAGSDGIIDIPYNINYNGRDNFPLTKPWHYNYTIPSSPRNVTAIAGELYANITWDAPELDGGFPIINYTMYRDGKFLAQIGNVTYYNDTNVSIGKTYYYFVSASNIMGEGPLSHEVNATPTLISTIPRSPTDNGIPWWLWITIVITIGFIILGIIITSRYKKKRLK